MKVGSLSFEELGLSSQLIRDLIAEDPKTAEFVGDYYSEDAVMNAAKNKQFDASNRETLVQVIEAQNSGLNRGEAWNASLEKLKDSKTFTITTGHQLNLMTGPLYSIYKIAQVIHLADKLSAQDNEHNYVPVFWMATEDHDFAEINHFKMFRDTITWELESNDSVVGRLSTDSIGPVLDEVKSKFSDPAAAEKIDALLSHYSANGTLAEATRALIHHLFADYGLMIIDGDDMTLKAEYVDVLKQEIEGEKTYKAVTETNQELTKNGYHTQVHVREINLFYIESDGRRERIVSNEKGVSIGDRELSTEELLAMVDAQPESFSPNALLRPVYQETVLPNLVYVGGGGEIAYWMQLKSTFEALGVAYPLIRVRDSNIILNSKDLELMKEFDVSIPQLKNDLQTFIKEWVNNNSDSSLSLYDERQKLEAFKEELKNKVEQLDKSLVQSLEGEHARWQKSLDSLEGKMIKAEKKRHEVRLNKLDKTREKIFPTNGFQERSENFLSYYLRDQNYIKSLIELEIHKEPSINILNP